jgi:Mce-associated membrane protein
VTDTARWRPVDFVLAELVTLALLSVIAVAIGGASALPWQTEAERVGQTNRDAAMAAERFVKIFLDVDYRRVDENAKEVIGVSTSPFRGQFAVNATDLRIAVTGAQSVTTGTVRAAGVEWADSKSARVLVAADAVVRSRLAKSPKRSHYRFIVSLAKVEGRWLVSNLAEER